MTEILILSDGKPGHLNQSLGLAQALIRRSPDCRYQIRSIDEGWRLLHAEPAPDLVVSAGRRTHLWNLLCKWRYGARNIVLMRPSLPAWLFDLCLVPQHDNPRSGRHLITTQGALNRMSSAAKIPGSAMVLIGGPSKHAIWDQTAVITQLDQILNEHPQLDIRVVTSRRTPKDFETYLALRSEVKLVTPESVDKDWLASQLPRTERVWVTLDSVSMVYEALTAGAAVSLIELPAVEGSRVMQGVESLSRQGWVNRVADRIRPPQTTEFNEADRVAAILLEKLDL